MTKLATLAENAIDEFRRQFGDLPKKLSRLNIPLLLVTGLLIGVGILFIYSAGRQTGGRLAGYWTRQLLWVVIGGIGMVFLAGLDYQVLGRYSAWIYLGSLSLLIVVLIFGVKVHGARSWLKLLPGINIQPAEFAKLGIIIPLAWFASFPSTDLKRWRHLGWILLITIIPMLLILLQPDMGSALVFIPIGLAILFVGGLRYRLILYAVLIALLAGPLVYKFGFRAHQQGRVLTFLKPIVPAPVYKVALQFTKAGIPESQRRAIQIRVDDNWNINQSLIAVGSGGFWGKGFGKGTQNTLGFLPRRVAPTDFIFSVIAEETGFVGSMILITAFLGLLFLCIYIAAKARDDFGRFMACAIAAMFSVHIFVNIGMTIRLLPIIGIPLPFVSYGGSFMILMLSCVGVLQSIYIHRQDNEGIGV